MEVYVLIFNSVCNPRQSSHKAKSAVCSPQGFSFCTAQTEMFGLFFTTASAPPFHTSFSFSIQILTVDLVKFGDLVAHKWAQTCFYHQLYFQVQKMLFGFWHGQSMQHVSALLKCLQKSTLHVLSY